MKTIHLLTTLMLVAGLALVVGPVPVANAATITVDTTVDDNTTNGNCTLREAIIAANTDTAVDNCPAGSGADTINLPAGSYTLTIAGTDEDAAATGDLDINDDLTITGDGQATTIIDGGALDRIFHILSGSTVEISGVTVRNGRVYGRGGGLYNEDGALLLNNMTVSGNWTNWGSIFNNNGGTVTLNNSTVSDNTVSTNGGGIYNKDEGTMTLNDSIVSANSANTGGGINNDGTMTLNNSTVSRNTASDAGGIYNYRGPLILNNSTVSSNTAVVGGGGIYSAGGGTVTLNSSTVSGNTAGVGGGIYNPSSTVILNNTIVADNPSGRDCSGLITSLGHNLDSDNSCNLTAAGDIPNANPLLGPLQDNGGPTETHALLSGSPAIDMGDDSTCPLTDQRGKPRPADGDGDGTAICDIGAVERQPVTVLTVPVDVKPQSCPNPLNVKKKGVLPVAILGTTSLDVTQIDPASVRLEGVAPLRWALEDVATPYEPYTGKEDAHDCNELGADGYEDLTLKFKAQEVVAALGNVSDGDVLVLELTANLKEEYGGMPIHGEDAIVILKKGKK